jgi:hypothetical protein
MLNFWTEVQSTKASSEMGHPVQAAVNKPVE